MPPQLNESIEQSTQATLLKSLRTVVRPIRTTVLKHKPDSIQRYLEANDRPLLAIVSLVRLNRVLPHHTTPGKSNSKSEPDPRFLVKVGI